MPIYEYECPKCKITTEHLHGYNAQPDLKCETCGTSLVRQFSLTSSIIIKPSFRAISNPKWLDKKIEKIRANPDLDPYQKHRDKDTPL